MVSKQLFESRGDYFLKPTSSLKTTTLALMVVGLLALVVGFATGQATRTWGAFLFNLMIFFSLALGGVVWSAIQDAISALWSRPVKRLYESFSSFLPVACLLFVIYFVCIGLNILSADKVYRWIDDPSMLDYFWGKKTWLQEWPMLIRSTVALGLILWIWRWQIRINTQADQAMLADKPGEAARLGKEANGKLRYWSSPILVAYGLLFTLLTFDLTMSLSPLWFSTLWGGWSFAVMMQMLMATLLLFMYAFKGTSIGKWVTQSQFHDVGKLMHGFTIFFAYLTYAHILTYWYGNIPEETEYFLHRMHSPWLELVIVTPVLGFLIPLFALLPKESKWLGSLTIPICALILTSQWLVNLLVVMPEVVDAAEFGLPLIELGVFLGMLGLFLLSIQRFGAKYPMVAIGDPLLHKSIERAAHH